MISIVGGGYSAAIAKAQGIEEMGYVFAGLLPTDGSRHRRRVVLTSSNSAYVELSATPAQLFQPDLHLCLTKDLAGEPRCYIPRCGAVDLTSYIDPANTYLRDVQPDGCVRRQHGGRPTGVGPW